MSLRPDHIDQVLTDKLNPVYLVAGDEPLLCLEAIDQLRAHFKAKGFTEREVLNVDASFSWAYLLESSQALSLFGDKKIIELRLENSRPDKQASAILIEYLSNPSPDNILLISATKLESKHKKSAWFKAIEKNGPFIEAWPIEVNALGPWIKRRAQSRQLNLSSDAIEVLKDRIEGNLLAAAQEIEKLALIAESQKIDADDVLNAVSDSSRYDVFGLVDAAIQGNPKRCQKILSVLAEDGTEPSVLLWSLSREVRTLYSLCFAQETGQSSDSVFSQYRVWGKRKNLLARAQQRFSLPQLQALLAACEQADLMIKGQQQGSPWLQLSTIALTLSGYPCLPR